MKLLLAAGSQRLRNETSIFGMSVSGQSAPGALFAGTLKGPVILTGGAFGPEAGIVAVILCLSVAVLLLWRTVRSGRIKHLGWARSNSSAGDVEASASTTRLEARG